MKHIVTTPPTQEPISVDAMRQFIGITQAGETSRDEIIASRIISARLWCEYFTNSHIMATTLTGYASQFADCCIDLNMPLVAVNSIKYLDTNGTEQTLANTEYQVDTVSHRVIPAYGKTWPTARVQANSVRIEYVSGYASAAVVPEPIKEAIKFVVGQWERFQNAYEGSGYPPDFPNVAKSLLQPYRDMRGVF
jgi:uncharacterized phiE125 gp8 family phage protein